LAFFAAVHTSCGTYFTKVRMMDYSCEDVKRLILEVISDVPSKVHYCKEFERK